MTNSPTSSSSSSCSNLFFSESENSVDAVLNEQDAIIHNLKLEVENLNEYSDTLLEELTTLTEYVKTNIVKSSNILRKLIENNVNNIDEFSISQQIIKGEIVRSLRILNNIYSKVSN